MCKPEGKWGKGGGSFQGKFGYKIRNFMELDFLGGEELLGPQNVDS